MYKFKLLIGAMLILFTSTNLYSEKLPYKIASNTKIVYLDIWASWCSPCKASFPWMNKLHNDFKNKGLEIIAVNVDNNKKDADKFLQKNLANFRIEYDNDKSIVKQFNLKVMPTSYILDKNGNILYKHEGFSNKSSVEIYKKIEELLQ